MINRPEQSRLNKICLPDAIHISQILITGESNSILILEKQQIQEQLEIKIIEQDPKVKTSRNCSNGRQGMERRSHR